MVHIYDASCEKCGKFYREEDPDELVEFNGKILCWPCVIDGRKPLENLSAKEMLDLIRMGHPYERGQPYSRMEVIDEIEKRGPALLEQLGWPTSDESVYRNRYTGDERTLRRLKNSYYEEGEKPDWWTEWYELFSIIEHWEPAVGQNLTRLKYLGSQGESMTLQEFAKGGS